jgi:hypothetical protein
MESTAHDTWQARRDLGWLRHVVIAFLVSRVLMLGIFTLVPMISAIPLSEWDKHDVSIRVRAENVLHGMQRVAFANDATFYLDLARDGYEEREFDTSRAANWAFFPMQPLVWRASAALTGEWFWSGVVVANALFFCGLCLLWHLARDLFSDDNAADDAVTFAAFWPTSYFASLPQTEALFFVLATLSLLAAARRRWWLVGISGLLGGATRVNGIFLAPAAVLEWYRSDRRAVDLAKIAMVGVGTAGFMFYLWQITGNPLAFKDIQVTWGRELHPPWTALLAYLSRPHRLVTEWNAEVLNFSMTLLAIASAVTCWRKGWRGIALFTALTVLAPLSTGTLMSMTRYIGVAPGVYLGFAAWSQRSRRSGQVLLIGLVAAMTLLCTLFAAGINVGGA